MELSARFLGFTAYGVQWVLWLLIFLSVTSIAMMLERLWHFSTYRPSPQALAREIRRLLASGPTLSLGSEGMGSAEALEGAVEGAKVRERLQLERNLAFLGTLGSNAPFIGLFGTVLGIIKAFHDLAGNQAGGPAVVMAGISEALVATAVGLMVAIPAVVAFNYFSRRVRTSMTQVDWMAYLALAEVKAGFAAAAAGTTPPLASVAPDAEGPVARSLGSRLLPIAAVGGLLLLGGGILLGRSTSPPARPVPLPIPAQGPNALPPASGPQAPPPATPAATLPTVAGPATSLPATPPGPIDAGAPATLAPAAIAPAAIAPAAIAPAAIAKLPTGPAVPAPAAGTPAPTAPAEIAPTAKPPAAIAKPAGTKPAAAPAPAGAKAGKTWKWKKKRPPGAAPPAANAGGAPPATPAKSEEAAPAKSEAAAPAAPAVP